MVANFIKIFLKPRGKKSFLKHLKPDCRILDVGCGTASPVYTRQILPHCHYTGMDVFVNTFAPGQEPENYLVVPPERFAEELEKMHGQFDAVISSHNLEHCNDRQRALDAVIGAVKPGGQLYISFPSRRSLVLPHRTGTLNYYDDPEHREDPPDIQMVTEHLRKSGVEFHLYNPYRPLLLSLIGFLLEPVSRIRRRVISCATWALYGFETIIWARKPAG